MPSPVRYEQGTFAEVGATPRRQVREHRQVRAHVARARARRQIPDAERRRALSHIAEMRVLLGAQRQETQRCAG